MVLAEKYTRPAIVLHWVIAVFIAVNVALALSWESMPDDWIRPMINTHKSIGITVLGLVILRILWRVTHAPPPMPDHYPKIERTGAHLAHFALYVVIVGLPVTGWMHNSAWKGAAENPMSIFGLFPWPQIGWIDSIEPVSKEVLHGVFGSWHTWFGYALYALFALHILGALKHQFVDRERELQRMLP